MAKIRMTAKKIEGRTKNSEEKTDNSGLIIRIQIPSYQSIAELLQGFGFIALLIAVMIIPHVYSSNYPFPYEFPRLMLFLILAVILGSILFVRLGIKGRKNVVQSPIINTLIIFLLSYIFSSIFSASPLISIIGHYGYWNLSLISIAAFITLALAVSNNRLVQKSQRLIAIAIVAAAAISNIAVTASTFATGSNFLTTPLQLDITQGNPKNLASFIVLGVPFLLAFIIEAKELWKQTIAASLLLFSFIVLIKISLTVPLLLAIAAIAIYLTYIKPKKIHFRRVLLGFILILAIITTFIGPIEKSFDLQKSYEHNVSSLQNLSSKYKTIVSVFIKKPLTGTGPEMLHSVYPQFREGSYNQDKQLVYFNNLYIHIIATTGILGGCSLVALLAVIVKQILLKFNELEPIELGFGSATLIWLTLGFYNIPSVTNLLMGAILIGTITYITRSHFEKHIDRDKKGSIIILITVIAALLSFYAIYNWNSAAKLIEETQTIRPNVDIEKSVEAVSRNPNEPHYRVVHAKNLLRFLQKQPDRSNRDEIIRQIKISLQTAQALDRWRLDTYYSASEIYASLDQFYPNKGYWRQATKYMLQAQEIAPQNQFTYLNTANIYFIQGKTDSALDELSKALKIDDEYWQAHLFRADLLLSQNKLEEARETATMVIEESEVAQYEEAAQNILLLIELAERTKQE